MTEADLLARARRGHIAIHELPALESRGDLTPAVLAAMVARGDLTLPDGALPPPEPAPMAAFAPLAARLADPPFVLPFPSVFMDMPGVPAAGFAAPAPKGLVVVPGALVPGFGPLFDDATAINWALGRAPAVFLLPVRYQLFSNIAMLSGSLLRGLRPVNQSADTPATYGTILTITSGFASTSGNISAAITMDAGAGSLTNIAVEDLWVDGTSAPASVDGITSFGQANAVTLSRVGVYKATGNGVSQVKNGALFADGWRIDTANALNCGSSGFTGNWADAELRNCHAQSNGSFGFFVNGGNSRFTSCRADLGGSDGFRIDTPSGNQAGGFLDAVTLNACGSQRNQSYGCNIINGSATGTNTRAPVIMTGCSWDGDGVNGGAGGGTFAGVRVAGAVVLVAAESSVLVHTEDVAAGCPNFAIRTDALGSGSGKPQLLRWDGGLLNSASATIISDAAPAALRQVSSAGIASGQYTGASVLVAVT